MTNYKQTEDSLHGSDARRPCEAIRTRKHRDATLTSRIMASIKSNGSKAEVALGRAMWSIGLRYRKQPRNVAGRPDYAFPNLKIAVFCDGDFWHGQAWKERGFAAFEAQFVGLQNAEFWQKKIAENIERDHRVNYWLRSEGWLVIRFSEAEVLTDPRRCAEFVKRTVRRQAYLAFAVASSRATSSTAFRQ